jgi:hypothetical protein
MENRKLYFIQDSDRPSHVIAESWQAALDKWKRIIASENDMEFEEVEEPQGITLIADTDDIIF